MGRALIVHAVLLGAMLASGCARVEVDDTSTVDTDQYRGARQNAPDTGWRFLPDTGDIVDTEDEVDEDVVHEGVGVHEYVPVDE